MKKSLSDEILGNIKDLSIEPLEKDIQRTICDWLCLKGYFFWRSNNIPVFGMNNGGKMTFRALPKYTPKGLPDIMVIHKGKFIALEIKRKKAKQTFEQEIFGKKLIENGGIYYILHCYGDIMHVSELFI